MRAITKSDFARERDFSRARLYQLIDDGRLKPAILEDGRIDADLAHEILDANLNQAKGQRRAGNVTSSAPSGNAAPRGSGQLELEEDEEPASERGSRRPGEQRDYWESRARREEAEAEIAQMKARERAGELVSAAEVRKEFVETARAVRNGVLAMIDRVAAVLDPANPARAHKLLTDEATRTLRELSAKLEERAGDPGAAGSAPTVQ